MLSYSTKPTDNILTCFRRLYDEKEVSKESIQQLMKIIISQVKNLFLML